MKNILKETTSLTNEDRKLMLEMFKALIKHNNKEEDNNDLK